MTSTSSRPQEGAGQGVSGAQIGANSSASGPSGADLKPFFFGGIASCVAETVTFPIDTAKTRLQLQGKFL